MQHNLLKENQEPSNADNTSISGAHAQAVELIDNTALVGRFPRDLCFHLFSFTLKNGDATLRALGSVNKMFYTRAKQYKITSQEFFYAVGDALTVIDGGRYDNFISRSLMNSLGNLLSPTYASLISSINTTHALYFTNQKDAEAFCTKTARTTYIKDHDIEYVDAISGVVAVQFKHKDVFSLKSRTIRLNGAETCVIFKTKPTNIAVISCGFFRGKALAEDNLKVNDKPNKCIIS